MTVRELIRKLIDCDMNKNVVIDLCVRSPGEVMPEAELRSAEVLTLDGWHDSVTIGANLAVDDVGLAAMGLQRKGG